MSDKTYKVRRGEEITLRLRADDVLPSRRKPEKFFNRGPLDVPIDDDLYVVPRPGIFLYDLGKRWNGSGYTEILYSPQISGGLPVLLNVPDEYYEYLITTQLQGDPFGTTDGEPNCRPLPRAPWLYIDLEFYRFREDEFDTYWDLIRRICWTPPNERPSLSGSPGTFCPTNNRKPSIAADGADLQLYVKSFWHYNMFDTRDEMLIVTDTPSIPWDFISTVEFTINQKQPLHIYLQPRRFIQTDQFNDLEPKKIYTADYIIWPGGEIPDYQIVQPQFRLDADAYAATIAHYFARIPNEADWFLGTQFGPWDLVLQGDFGIWDKIWLVGVVRQGTNIFYLWWSGNTVSRTVAFGGHWKPPA